MSLQHVISLLRRRSAWDALDALIEEWVSLRHGALASAANRLARGIETKPPRSAAVHVLGGRVFRIPSDPLADVLVSPRGAVVVNSITFPNPSGRYESRSLHPLQGSSDLSFEAELLESLASGPPNPLLQPELLELVSTGAWRDLRLTHPFWTLLEKSGDAEFANSVSEIAEHPAGAIALAHLRTYAAGPALRELGLLNDAINDAIESVNRVRLQADAVLETLSWRNSDALQVFGDWLQERGDPWGQVVAARARGLDSLEDLEERHRLRWAERLGVGIAPQRTRFIQGGLAVTVERFSDLVTRPPGPLWRLVRELRIPHGPRADQFIPEPFDVQALAQWLTHQHIDLDLVTGAEWIVPALGSAPTPVNVLNLVVSTLPELVWTSVGFSRLQSITGNARADALVRLIEGAAHLPELKALAFADSGRWRFSMRRERHWRWEVERVAPSARADVLRLSEAAALIGASPCSTADERSQ